MSKSNWEEAQRNVSMCRCAALGAELKQISNINKVKNIYRVSQNEDRLNKFQKCVIIVK